VREDFTGQSSPRSAKAMVKKHDAHLDRLAGTTLQRRLRACPPDAPCPDVTRHSNGQASFGPLRRVFARRVGRESKHHSGCLDPLHGGATPVAPCLHELRWLLLEPHFVWGSHGCASRHKHRVLRVIASSRMGSLRRNWAKIACRRSLQYGLDLPTQLRLLKAPPKSSSQ